MKVTLHVKCLYYFLEIERKNILDTLIDIQATSFLRTIHESGSNGLRKMLTNGDHPLTVFYLDNGGMEFTQVGV